MIHLCFIHGETYFQHEIKTGEGGCITQKSDEQIQCETQRSHSGECVLRCDTV
jgi:hypothetical protein